MSSDLHDKLVINVIYYYLKRENIEKLATLNENNEYEFNRHVIRSLPHFIFMLKDKYFKLNALKKYIYYNCDYVYANISINDDLFSQRANDIWNLYMIFEGEIRNKKKAIIEEEKLNQQANNEKNYVHLDENDILIINPVIDLAIISFCYQRNLKQMQVNSNNIYKIVTSDEKFNFNENNIEIIDLVKKFKEFQFQDYK